MFWIVMWIFSQQMFKFVSPLLLTEARANPNFRKKERNELTKKYLIKTLAKNTGLSDFCRKVNWIFRRYN